MPSIDSIKASDGSGNANTATVTNQRIAPATTIQVDTVAGFPTNFHGTMGTPHTFTDPVTGEDITVISEATAVDFKGHVDGSNLEIDTIAPGYTDGGSEVGDIVVIRPTTQWADEVAGILDVSHNDDGTLKVADGGAIDDENGNEQLQFGTTASAVNHTKVTNAATGNAPEISAVGSDTDVDIKISPKGDGIIDLNGAATNRYVCKVVRAAAQTIATNGSNISFDSEEYDPLDMHSNSTNPTRVTVPVAGFYLITGTVTFDGNSTGRRGIQFKKNGSAILPTYMSLFPSVVVGTIAPSATTFVECAAGDYIEMEAYQDTGGNLGTTANRTSMTVMLAHAI